MGTSFEVERGNGAAARPVGTALGRESRPRPETTVPIQRIADGDRGTGGESLADFLGYFSIGLGLAEAVMPGVMARVIGIDHEDETNRTTLRLMGLREISHGVAVLSTGERRAQALWSRVAGDALDLALLGKALANPNNDRGRTLFATANVLAVTALDVMCARLLSSQPEDTPHARSLEQGLVRTRRSVTIRKPVEEVYAFWKAPENFPRFMRHIESVEQLDERRARWTAKAPAGATVTWVARITEDVPNERIAWRSEPGADVENQGFVEFRPAPGGRGTEVRLELLYHPPFGKLGSKVAMLWREEPGQQAQDDLRHLKQVMEIGEITISDATKRRGMHPAVPDDAPAQL